MKAFIWWLRSAFCKHEWKTLKNGVVEIQRCDHGAVPWYAIVLRECTKCGWRWKQKDYL